MKRSKHMALWVLGSATVLAGCTGGVTGDGSAVVKQELQQDFYTTKEDCEKDWGTESEDCAPTAGLAASNGANLTNGTDTSSTLAPMYHYAGPRYYWNRAIGHPIAVSANGVSRVVSHGAMSTGSASSGKSMPAGSITRGGFGSTAHGFSAGG